MYITMDMRSVIIRIQKKKTHPDLISPNYVADVAYEMGLELTSNQITYISDNWL